MANLDPEYKGLDATTLVRGAHQPGTGGFCFQECVAQEGFLRNGEDWDAGNISIALRQTGQRINDAVASDTVRQLLKTSIVQVMNSSNADAALERRRAYVMLDGAARKFYPAFLDFIGYTQQATTMRNLSPVTNVATANAARVAMRPHTISLNLALSSKQAVVGPPTQYAYRAYQSVIYGSGRAFLLPSDLPDEYLIRRVDGLQGTLDKTSALAVFGSNNLGIGGLFDTLALLAIGSFREAVSVQ